MKKQYILLFSVLLTLTSFSQRNELAAGYQLSLPQGAMKNGWQTGHGIQVQYHRFLREVKGLGFGVSMGYGNYAWDRKPQQYRFRDGSITNTTAVLSSSLAQFAFSAKAIPFVQKSFSPFFEFQAGYFGMYSSIYIEDPTDPLACRALENRNLVRSGTFYQAATAGLQWRLAGKGQADKHLLAFSARYARGGNMEYANMNRTYDHHSSTSNTTPDPETGGRPLMVRFINVQNNEQHDHTVAEVYNHPLRMMQFNLQYTFRFNKINPH